MVSRNLILATIVVVATTMLPMSTAFAPQASIASTRSTPLYIFGGKKEKEDFSDIEVRDLTREEMLEINKKNEEVMNMELGMMTAFGLFTSIPMLYLCWVAFFSD